MLEEKVVMPPFDIFLLKTMFAFAPLSLLFGFELGPPGLAPN